MKKHANLGRREFIAGVSAFAVGCARLQGNDLAVRFETAEGPITAVLHAKRAPKTVANFLQYVDAGLYAGASFYRAVRPSQDVNPVPINVIQGGLLKYSEIFPPIELETTRQTGLSHTDGAISMAREVPGWPTSLATSEFFICVGDNTVLDFGGDRNSDGQGFAAFGKVAEGMDIVRKIHQMPFGSGGKANWVGQMLADPVDIRSVSRI